MLRSATLLLAVLLLSALGACSRQDAADPRSAAPLVRTAVVREATSPSRVFSGTVAARVQSDLGFRVPGKVLARLVDAGQPVRRGQVLMRIDAVDLELAAAAQQQLVAAARARARRALDDEARFRDLPGTGAISASAYDQAKAAADAAEAELSAAEAQADVARNARRYAELRADGDGVVVETLVEPGQVVNAGQIVVRVAHAGRREAVVQLPETLRPAVGSVAEASTVGRDALTAPATLRQLSDAADRQTRTFEARYVLERDLANVPLGTTIAVRIAMPRASQAIFQVPIGALFDSGTGPGVWVVGGTPEKVSWRPVTVDQVRSDSALVGGELVQGERVVALGAHLLREGQYVRVSADAVATVGASARR